MNHKENVIFKDITDKGEDLLRDLSRRSYIQVCKELAYFFQSAADDAQKNQDREDRDALEAAQEEYDREPHAADI